jgi:hypothetical protein
MVDMVLEAENFPSAQSFLNNEHFIGSLFSLVQVEYCA